MAMKNLIEALRNTGDPRDSQRAERVASMLVERGSDLFLSPDVAPEEPKLPAQEFRIFTDYEREQLKKDDALILNLIGESAAEEQSFKYTVDGRVLLKLPPIRMDVAIYTDPKKFPIPDSEYKDLMTQEQLAEKESQALRERLELTDDGLDVIIPDPVSTLTELIHTYLVGTPNEGKRIQAFNVGHTTLFNGNAKAADQADHPHASTLDGVAGPGDCAVVLNLCLLLGHSNFRVVRLVVAKKK